MRKMLITLTILTLPFVTMMSFATEIPYCNDTDSQMTSREKTLLQQLVPAFASTMRCEIGSNCLLPFSKSTQNGTTYKKISIAWKQACGPVINGIYQLGNADGLGSTFICESTQMQTRCYPEGYDRAPYIYPDEIKETASNS